MFHLRYAIIARQTLADLEKNPAKAGLVKQIKKSLCYLQTNPRHPSLNTHLYDAIPNPLDKNKKVFGAYAQNNTPSAHRILFCYGPEHTIYIIAIIPHLK